MPQVVTIRSWRKPVTPEFGVDVVSHAIPYVRTGYDAFKPSRDVIARVMLTGSTKKIISCYSEKVRDNISVLGIRSLGRFASNGNFEMSLLFCRSPKNQKCLFFSRTPINIIDYVKFYVTLYDIKLKSS